MPPDSSSSARPFEPTGIPPAPFSPPPWTNAARSRISIVTQTSGSVTSTVSPGSSDSSSAPYSAQISGEPSRKRLSLRLATHLKRDAPRSSSDACAAIVRRMASISFSHS